MSDSDADHDSHPGTAKANETARTAAGEMALSARSVAEFAPLVGRYRSLRETGFQLNRKIVETLSRADLKDGATALNMYRQNAITLETEDHAAILMDFCLQDVWHGGRNVVRRYLEETPPPADSDEMRILRATVDAFYSVFVIEGAKRAVGIDVRDVLGVGRYPVMDVNFGSTAIPGRAIAMRLLCVEGIWMSTGASLPAEPAVLERIAAGLKKILPAGASLDQLSPRRRSDVTAMMIRACVAGGALEQVAYADPGKSVPAGRAGGAGKAGPVGFGEPGDRRYLAAAKIGRNDPCPCGSGRKYKKCCGHGRS